MSNLAVRMFQSVLDVFSFGSLDESGVVLRPRMDDSIHVRDYEVKEVLLCHESDLIVWLVTHDKFLTHKNYRHEAEDYVSAYFVNVFTFHPDSGKMKHAR
jgi:hypothetical protein